MNKWLKVGAILFLLLLLFIPTIVAMKYVAISQIYSYFVDSISNVTGLNKYLVKAGVALMLVPLFIGLKLFFSIRKKRRYIGTAILVTLLVLYNLSLYHFTKDLYFAFSEGKVLKWYALTPEGVKFFDRPGVEPVYGMPLKPVTPDIIRNLKLLQKGEFKPVDPTNINWFNPITGEPQVWYYQYPDGSFEFYDKPGHHPITGDPLKAATKQIYFDWREKTKPKADSLKIPESLKKREDIKKPKDQQLAMAKKPEIDEREKRLNEFKSIINQSVITYSDKPNIAMVIESLRTEGGLSPESTLINHLKKDKINIIDHFFKEAFKTKGYFREIYGGNTEILRQSDALSKIDYLIIGKIDYTFRKGSQIDRDLVSCNINFFYKVINKKGDIAKSDSINVIGPGFSEDAALERGLEMLAERHSDRIIKSFL
jgi:hypothetical protein